MTSRNKQGVLEIFIQIKTLEERARLAAWEILEEIGLSRHSVDRVAEIIAEKIHEQKALDIDKACEWLGPHLAEVADRYDSTASLLLRLVKENFRKAMEREL